MALAPLSSLSITPSQRPASPEESALDELESISSHESDSTHEGTFMEAPVKWLRALEEGSTTEKVLAFVLKVFTVLILGVSVIGLIPLVIGVSEYTRQNMQTEPPSVESDASDSEEDAVSSDGESEEILDAETLREEFSALTESVSRDFELSKRAAQSDQETASIFLERLRAQDKISACFQFFFKVHKHLQQSGTRFESPEIGVNACLDLLFKPASIPSDFKESQTPPQEAGLETEQQEENPYAAILAQRTLTYRDF